MNLHVRDKDEFIFSWNEFPVRNFTWKKLIL